MARTSGRRRPRRITEEGRKQAAALQRLHLQDSFSVLEKARMPVLAAIQGGCIGGAVDMVTAADCRYATDDALFCIQEINIGMTADVGTLQRLPKLIPEGVARSWPTPAGGCRRARRSRSGSSTRCTPTTTRC
ncbi:MAG: enoyl-CoA hydratase-related protein [Acidimicrobiales bacterium]